MGVKAHEVSFTYPGQEDKSLDEINLTIKEGECVLICGPSGSGKTTFTRLLNGISPNYVLGELNGSLDVFDLDPKSDPIEDFVPLVGSVFQNPKNQHFATTTTDELALPLENTGVERSRIHEIINIVSEFFSLEDLLDRDIFKLSGGQKQQVALASACVLKPSLLVLDEISSNLSSKAIQRLRAMLIRLKEENITVVLTEHRLAWSKGLVDRYLLFGNGQITKEWTKQEMDNLTNLDLNSLGLRSVDLTQDKEKVKKLTQIDNKLNPALELTNLAIGYQKNQPIKENVNMSFSKGHIYGLLGENGIGKSTLASTLTGIQKALAGQIYWKGSPVSGKDLKKLAFLVMQDVNYQLFSSSVEEEVLLSAKHPDQLDPVLERLGLIEYKDRHPMSLSGGQKQRVMIASAILSGKEIIIFDEPTSGLDYYNMKEVGQLLVDLKSQDKVIIVISHDLELIAGWCDSAIQLG